MSIERELRGNWDNVYYPAPEPMVEEAMAPGQQPGDVLVAEAGGGGAAFGVYPGMGKRSQKSNIGEKMIIGAPDFAAGTARGIATSAGGFGGDLQKIGRFAYALAADNQGGSFQEKLQRAAITMEDPTFFPSSEDLSKTGYTIPGTNFTIPPFSPAVPPGTTAFGMTPEERQQAAELGQNVGELVGDPIMLAKGGQMAVKGAMAAGKALAPTAAEMAVKTMDKLGSPVMMNAVPPSPSAAGAATKAMAPASDIGFYSAVEKAALNVQRNSGSGQAFLNDITKGENVKLDEIKWMGLDDFLKGKKNVTKQEVQDFVSGNRLDVQEIGLSDTGLRKKFSVNSPLDQDFYDVLDKNNNVVFTGKEDDADYFIDRSQTKFGKYTLPGGENYREILLTLPPKQTGASQISFKSSNDVENFLTDMSLTGYEKLDYGRIDDGNVVEFGGAIPSNVMQIIRNNDGDIIAGKSTAGSTYGSSHFEQQNILAHIRVNDRVDADGKKMLLIEEVQSDWHQAGREKGYQRKDLTADQIDLKYIPPTVPEGQNPANYPGYYEAFDKNTGAFVGRHSGSLSQEQAMRDAVSSANQFKTGVPDAPFKDTWYQLALKRALRYAADNGYDRVGLTTGKQQAERYDLAKQINELSYKKIEDDLTLSLGDGPYYEVSAIDKNNSPVLKKQVTEKELPNLVGKEMAKKIINGEGSGYPDGSISSGSKVFTGIDLQVGGEGMKKYYDDIYPKFLEKYGKKWGASVGEIGIGLPPKTSSSWAYFRDWFAENHSDVGSSATALSNWEKGSNNKYVKEFEKFRKTSTQQEPVRYIDITPEMRKSVQKGQPLAAVSSESTVA